MGAPRGRTPHFPLFPAYRQFGLEFSLRGSLARPEQLGRRTPKGVLEGKKHLADDGARILGPLLPAQDERMRQDPFVNKGGTVVGRGLDLYILEAFHQVSPFLAPRNREGGRRRAQARGDGADGALAFQ